MVLYVTEDEVRSVLKMEDCVPAIEDLFQQEADAKAESKPTVELSVPTGGTFRLKAGGAYGSGVYGFKAYGSGGYLIFIYDQTLGFQGIVAAHWLTQMRTGAVSAVAVKHMARPDATTLGIIGTGREARTQIEALRLVRPLSHVKAFSRTPETREAFASEMRQKFEIDVEPVGSGEECVKDVDIIVTITSTRDPVLFGSWLPGGAHICAVGATGLVRREVDEDVVARASTIVVEQLAAAQAECGELVYAANHGKLDWAKVHELKDLVTGSVQVRQDPSEISLFDSFGVGNEDVMVGALALRKAREAGLGTELDLPTQAPTRAASGRAARQPA